MSTKDLDPRTFALKAENIPLSDVLKKLMEQTGITVADQRQTKEEKRQTWDFNNVPFWQALDQIAAATGSGLSLYQPEGGIALVDGPNRPLPVGYGSVFRTVVKRITVGRDLDTDSHLCSVQLEVAWEPRFQPFYLDPGSIMVAYGPDKSGAQRQVRQADKGQLNVTGRTVAEIDVQVPAPDRSVTNVKTLEGSFAVIGPTKMLTFVFDKLKAAPTESVQEGIRAGLAELVQEVDHWVVKVALHYPKGAPHFESYQSWLGNNRITLEKIGGKERWAPNGERILKMTGSQASIEYYFENCSGKNADDWRAVYRTPGPIVEMTTTFRFRDLPLP